MSNAKANNRSLWRWVWSAWGLPLFVPILTWIFLEFFELKNAFHVSFGTGDLVPLIAMMCLITSQEIDTIPENERTNFLIAINEALIVFSVIFWIVFGFIKIGVLLKFPLEAEGGVKMANYVSVGSIVTLAGISLLCLFSRVVVHRCKK